ncbi:hypothetical protein MTF68_08160 [Pseudoalteromonas sp. 2CM37A]|uniref:hypothetical protein n=1 Tax=Pseudoalteromonas sp. 2CM37A TaxID=2929853 RepID=UPI0020C00323|nr:hypothetical protein [Pseudoalteromonas sp. 2CM37A]MCK8117535.1 hypothetical protein [Pseudoalteromonas sp. 2CM37A]
MKLFKKALLATAIMGTMGAQAATISSEALNLSKEGAALGVIPTEQTVVFDVVVDKDHPSASVITINFDKNVDVNDLLGGDVIQTVGGGTAYAGDVAFNYGTGSFTFDDVKVFDRDQTKGETDAISFKVNLGNPLTANSAFRVTLGAHQLDAERDDQGNVVTAGPSKDEVTIAGVSNINYISKKPDGSVIETGVGELAKEVSQFSFKIDEKLDGIISRTDQTDWSETNFTSIESDELEYTLTNDETMGLALLGADIKVEFTGNFDGVEDFNGISRPAIDYVSVPAVGRTLGARAPFVTNDAGKTIAVDMRYATAAGAEGTKLAADEQLVFTNEDDTANPDARQASEIPVTGDVKATVTLYNADNNLKAIPTGGYPLYNDVDAGKWTIDATIVNVPYMPINAPSTNSFIHFANEIDREVDVIVTAIDNNGVEYGPMDLGFNLRPDTVEKLSMKYMDELFGLGGQSTKLSLTFNLDAFKNDVGVYAVSQNDQGRTEVSSSQQK